MKVYDWLTFMIMILNDFWMNFIDLPRSFWFAMTFSFIITQLPRPPLNFFTHFFKNPYHFTLGLNCIHYILNTLPQFFHIYHSHLCFAMYIVLYCISFKTTLKLVVMKILFKDTLKERLINVWWDSDQIWTFYVKKDSDYWFYQ